MWLYNGKIEVANHDVKFLLFNVLQLANVNCPPNVVVNWNEFILLFNVLQLANVNCPPNVVVNWNEFILTI